jgi:two-component sensor histidine kinase
MLTMLKRLGLSGRPQSQPRTGSRDDMYHRYRELQLRFEEYDHRVKNNTQMMLSVLSMAGRSAINQEARFALDAVASKVRAIARIHAILQSAGREPTLRCDELVRDLSRAIQAGSPCNFALIVDTDPVELPGSAALPLGLIVHELLTNAIKHGVTPESGRVRVSLKNVDDAVELRVEDNGPGLHAGESAGHDCGLTLMQQLAAQLHGQFEMHPGPGGRGVLRFNRTQLCR